MFEFGNGSVKDDVGLAREFGEGAIDFASAKGFEAGEIGVGKIAAYFGRIDVNAADDFGPGF